MSLCGNTGPAPAIQHVILVMLENRSYTQVIGNASAPYQNSLAADCGVASEMFGATHTSAANYLAVSAGEYPPAAPPGCGSVAKCADTNESVYQQLDAAGLSWKVYEEGMPSACDPKSDTTTDYKNGHNPAIFYTGVPASECAANDVGVASLDSANGAFYTDLQNNTLPSLSWIAPTTANDGENVCDGNCALGIADTWLSNFIGLVTASPEYQAGTTLILVTYDEGNGADYATGEDCTNETADLAGAQPSCHVPLFAVYPFTPAGDHDAAFFDHYSLTRTVEGLFDLPSLAHAADAQTSSLAGHFGIAG